MIAAAMRKTVDLNASHFVPTSHTGSACRAMSYVRFVLENYRGAGVCGEAKTKRTSLIA